MKQPHVIAIDLAKNVFQLHANDIHGNALWSRTVQRSKLAEVLARQPTCLIAMEACCGAHFWARKALNLGHDVKVMAPQHVKPFVMVHKNDQRDACAIAEAAIRPSIPAISPKSASHLEIQVIHKVRERVIQNRTAIGNEIRGILLEFGIALPKGNTHLKHGLNRILEDATNDLPVRVRWVVSDLQQQWYADDAKASEYLTQLKEIERQIEPCRKLAGIDGIGPINATALYAYAGDIRQYQSGRHFSASIGLVPRQHASGGKTVMYGISKQGNRMVRKQLVHGARAAYRRLLKEAEPTRLGSWVQRMKASGKHPNKIIVALANKLARIAWAVMAHDVEYKRIRNA